MALLGARALRSGRIKAAAHIHEEVNFRTSNFSALEYVMRGVLNFVGIMLLLFILSFFMLFVVVLLSHQPDSPHSLPMPSFTSEFAKVLIGGVSGCFGGVAHFLLQFPGFEILKGNSRPFLR